MATITITLKDEADGINIQAVCTETTNEVTPAMAVSYQLMKLASQIHEMSAVPEGEQSLRNSPAH